MKTTEQWHALVEIFNRIKGINFWTIIPDMTPGEVQLLSSICRSSEEECRVSDLYETCGMHPTVISRLMNCLEERQLIVRNTHKGDRRVTDVCATEAGIEKNRRNKDLLCAYWHSVLENVPDTDLDAMLHSLNVIVESMTGVLAREKDQRKGEKA